MQNFFHQLFDYNFYCNKGFIEEYSSLKGLPKNTVQLFSHILNAHHIWNGRILGEIAKYDVWKEHDIESWEDIHYQNQRTSFEIIKNANDFDKRITYENSKGNVFSNSLKDILFHIINHSTHHRGQILMDLRSNGIEPNSLDYIFYKR